MENINVMSHHFPILYAEDEDDDILLVRKAFEKAGVTNPIYTVIDGQQAIDYLSAKGPYADRKQYPLPGLLLLDLNLPLRSGFDILHWIRQNAQLKTMIVICSSSGQWCDIERAYALGANGYIRKPSDFEKLVQLARSIKDYWLTNNEPPFQTL
jgi:CheY-like chemotaxis protein